MSKAPTSSSVSSSTSATAAIARFCRLRAYYKPEELVGKLIVMIANLAPRKIRGLVSAGMILTAERPDGKLTSSPPVGMSAPGSKIS